ncbi:hypothetical protein F4801DRAFT_599298 [Xylaria longipes]|nr:hypothetical protein F4801DRAFT_599298 [Xylaria longipes]
MSQTCELSGGYWTVYCTTQLKPIPSLKAGAPETSPLGGCSEDFERDQLHEQMKRGGLPREGGQKKTTPTATASPLPPSLEVRGSERIRKQNVKETPDLPAMTQPAPQRRANHGSKEFIAGVPEPNQRVFGSDQSSHDDSDMEVSAATLTSLGASDPRSARGPYRPKAKNPNEDSFRLRNIMIEVSRDERTPDFKGFLVEEPIKIPFDKTKDLQKSLRYFLEKASKANHGEDSYGAVEQLREGINKWAATTDLAAVTNQEFENDLEHCKAPANEAVFQRTVMMSIIDRSHLKPAFDFNCEGQWSLQGSNPLPSDGDDAITGPKPDLAIFFRFDYLVGRALRNKQIPEELKSCINPDNYEKRCFPLYS